MDSQVLFYRVVPVCVCVCVVCVRADLCVACVGVRVHMAFQYISSMSSVYLFLVPNRIGVCAHVCVRV